jgi:hypothetical protein
MLCQAFDSPQGVRIAIASSRVTLSQRETAKDERVSGVSGSRNPEHGHLPVDPKGSLSGKEQDLAVGIQC